MADYEGKTVAEILQTKLAGIKRAALAKGSPSWDDILDLTWEELEAKYLQGERGFKTFHKLLRARRFDK